MVWYHYCLPLNEPEKQGDQSRHNCQCCKFIVPEWLNRRPLPLAACQSQKQQCNVAALGWDENTLLSKCQLLAVGCSFNVLLHVSPWPAVDALCSLYFPEYGWDQSVLAKPYFSHMLKQVFRIKHELKSHWIKNQSDTSGLYLKITSTKPILAQFLIAWVARESNHIEAASGLLEN